MLTLGIGFSFWKVIIAGVVFSSPLIWFGPHRKVRPFKVYKIQNNWKENRSLFQDEESYLVNNASKIGIKDFEINDNVIRYSEHKGSIWVALFLIPALFLWLLAVIN